MEFDSYFASRTSPSRGRRDDDPTYVRDRQAIDLKLKGRFERIFEKYAKDFSSVGDEIDIETGRVVVDNGHLTHMQHERDTGKSASAQFLRDFAQELDQENEENDDEENPEDTEDPQEEGERHVEDDEDDSDAGDEESANEEEDHGELDELALDPMLAHQGGQQHVVASTEVSQTLISDSLNSLMPHQDASGRIDPDAIRALGLSIANQIASFLMRQPSGSVIPRPLGTWDAPPLPSDAFSPPSFFDNRRETTPLPNRFPSVIDSPSAGQSIWAPTESHNKRRRLLGHPSIHRHPQRYSVVAPDDDLSDAASVPNSSSGRIYSREEDDLIMRLRDEGKLTWAVITRYLPGRSAGAVSARYKRNKDSSRSVIVKREIIEILDGEDDIPETPDTFIPGNVPGSGPQAFASPARPPPKTPFLRQALEHRIARHGDPGELPIAIEDDAINSLRESSADSPARINSNNHGYPPGSRKNRHGIRPHYDTFDSSHGTGTFGMLRADYAMPMHSVPQEHMLGPVHARTGTFGVLKLGKEKPPKPAKAPRKSGEPRKARQSSKSKRPQTAGSSLQSKVSRRPENSRVEASARHNHTSRSHTQDENESSYMTMQSDTLQLSEAAEPHAQPSYLPMSAPPPPPSFVERVPQQHTITERDEDNDGDVSEILETPARTRHTDLAAFALHNGPYFLSNVASPSIENGFLASPRPDPESLHTQHPSSPPPLPTPRSEVSTRSTRNSMHGLSRKEAPQPPAPVARMVLDPSFGHDPYATPGTTVRGTPVTVKGHRTLRKPVLVDLEDGSEDELAL